MKAPAVLTFISLSSFRAIAAFTPSAPIQGNDSRAFRQDNGMNFRISTEQYLKFTTPRKSGRRYGPPDDDEVGPTGRYDELDENNKIIETTFVVEEEETSQPQVQRSPCCMPDNTCLSSKSDKELSKMIKRNFPDMSLFDRMILSRRQMERLLVNGSLWWCGVYNLNG